jgi:phosphoribosylformylglycinamidine synthase
VCYIGSITGDGRMVVETNAQDAAKNEIAVDVPLDKVLGKMPQKVFELNSEPNTLKPLTADVTGEGQHFENNCMRDEVAKLFSLLDVGSKRFLTNKVDRSVTGNRSFFFIIRFESFFYFQNCDVHIYLLLCFATVQV